MEQAAEQAPRRRVADLAPARGPPTPVDGTAPSCPRAWSVDFHILFQNGKAKQALERYQEVFVDIGERMVLGQADQQHGNLSMKSG